MSSHAELIYPSRLLAAIAVALVLASVRVGAPDASPEVAEHRIAPDSRQPSMTHRQAEAEAKTRALEARGKAELQMTANQGLYDVHHYGLDLTLDPVSQTLTGLVSVQAEVAGASLATLDLDLLAGMSVYSVTADGSAAGFSRNGDVLTITLDRTYTMGEMVEITVSYGGNPAGSSFGWDTHGTEYMIWTKSEPFGARHWWPCKDVNSDKADSVDVRVTVPDHLTAVSNGLLIANVDNGATRTFHWRTRYPICTYLVSLAIHPYTFFHDWYTPLGGGAPMEVQYYVYPDNYDNVQAVYALTVPMLEVFAQSFGEYPFVQEKYGHADFVWGGGMEHQTISSIGFWSEDLIAHELAHQWWGDMITCENFEHIWLNEGLATWSEARWKEVREGTAVYRSYMDAAAFYGPGTIYVEDPEGNPSSIFDSNLSYNKGSWVIHMLRGVLGDTDFFAGLAAYRAQYEYGSATTEQFRDVMEAVSGQDLDIFFDQWIYGEYFPVYRHSWTQDGSWIQLTIEQVQTNTGPFEMPVPIRIVTTTDTYDFTVHNSLTLQEYTLPVLGTVQSIELDPDRWILHFDRSPVTSPTLDCGVLLVNAVHWETYWPLIESAYADSIFSGSFDVSFWDTFSEPPWGYPASLPAPLGHGKVPADTLGQFSTVIWVGNNYNGDLPRWQETPILSYLEAGGNVLLMARRTRSFVEPELTGYLGVTWAETDAVLGNCVAAYPGLVDVPFIGTQSYNDVFLTTVGEQSTLLFTDTQGFPGVRGTGVHAHPESGGTHRTDGGRLIVLSGRPYRSDHAAVRGNSQFILSHFFGEPYVPVAVPTPRQVTELQLFPAQPNPFISRTVISFALPSPGPVTLGVFDVAGRRVRTLVAGDLSVGEQRIVWDGSSDGGRTVAPGLYLIQLESGGQRLTRKALFMR